MIDRNQNQPDPLDDLLDRALATYTPPLPPSGWEDRLQARLAAAAQAPSRHPRPVPLWLWVPSFALAASAILAVFLFRVHTPAVRPNLATNQTHAVSPSVPIPLTPRPAAAPHIAPAASLHYTAVSRPTPRRPTEQQELIAQLLAKAPEAVASLARADEEQGKPLVIQPLPSDPLVIEPIRITRIDDNPAGSGGSF
jgi:hypothetical protein